jgi:Bacterial protein of unknown function (DUF922)
MGGQKIGILGLDDQKKPSDGREKTPFPAGFSDPGPIGEDDSDDAEELAGVPTVTAVNKVWDASARRTTPAIDGHGKTLQELKASLDASQGTHWGEGGGELNLDPTGKVKAGENVTLTLRGELINRIPNWVERDQATATAKAEWDRFIAKLKAHEECHVDIALKAFEKLAADFIGKKITEVNKMFLDAKKQLKDDQKALDDRTHNGQDMGVPCGDALLNTAIK